MKIYFEDGKLLSYNEFADEYSNENSHYFIRIDAANGYSNCEYVLKRLLNENENIIVYTNHIGALSNFYAWNDKLKVPEIYIRASNDKQFVRIDKLYDGQLRPAHNIEKMYVNNLFAEYPRTAVDCRLKEGI